MGGGARIRCFLRCNMGAPMDARHRLSLLSPGPCSVCCCGVRCRRLKRGRGRECVWRRSRWIAGGRRCERSKQARGYRISRLLTSAESAAGVGRIARGRGWISAEAGRRRTHTAAGRRRGDDGRAGSAGNLNCARRSGCRVQPQRWGRIESEDDAVEGRREARTSINAQAELELDGSRARLHIGSTTPAYETTPFGCPRPGHRSQCRVMSCHATRYSVARGIQHVCPRCFQAHTVRYTSTQVRRYAGTQVRRYKPSQRHIPRIHERRLCS